MKRLLLFSMLIASSPMVLASEDAPSDPAVAALQGLKVLVTDEHGSSSAAAAVECDRKESKEKEEVQNILALYKATGAHIQLHFPPTLDQIPALSALYVARKKFAHLTPFDVTKLGIDQILTPGSTKHEIAELEALLNHTKARPVALSIDAITRVAVSELPTLLACDFEEEIENNPALAVLKDFRRFLKEMPNASPSDRVPEPSLRHELFAARAQLAAEKAKSAALEASLKDLTDALKK